MAVQGSAVIWWVRRDLRLADNRALTAAVAQARAQEGWVLPLFVLDDALLEHANASEKRNAMLAGSLAALDEALRRLGSRLVVRRGEALATLQAMWGESGASAIHAEADGSGYAPARDARVAAALPLHLHEGVSIRPAGSVQSDEGRAYARFGAYKRRWLALPPPAAQLTAPEQIPSSRRLAALADDNPAPLSMRSGAWRPEEHGWTPGEAEAQRRLGEFLQGGRNAPPLAAYAEERNFPALAGTSQLSPYLHFGAISARACAAEALALPEGASQEEGLRSGVAAWLSELIWRDFFLHAQAAPLMRQEGRDAVDRTDREWREDAGDLVVWQRGETGYPLVDAAMRQLQATGWMHNRCRMVVASFLVKHLLIHWRAGERFFMQHLIDGDSAANHGNWRWIAGVGADASPWFRVFNPVLQARRFDPDGAFVRAWLPELADLPTGAIFEPWKVTAAEQQRSGFRPGKAYPLPMIEHEFARTRALAQRRGR